MDSSNQINAALLAGGGALRLRDWQMLTQAVRWQADQGELIRLLPGIYCARESFADPQVRMHAVILRYPDAVLIGAAAARCSFWPSAPMSTVAVATGRGQVTPQLGYHLSQRCIPPDLIAESHGLRFTDPALTAIDLATSDSADAIDIALRTRATTLDRMWLALRETSTRVGNVDRRALLLDSRDEPWSAAERLAHLFLRGAGITGWVANLPVSAGGSRYFLDIGFRAKRLALEIDGRIHQLDEKLFHSDRIRQNALILDGWRVLRFTWRILDDHPEIFINEVRRALRSR